MKEKIQKEYVIHIQNDFITLKKPGIIRKLAIPRKGPYKVVKDNKNGSILIEKARTDIANVNVRQVASYYYRSETPDTTN